MNRPALNLAPAASRSALAASFAPHPQLVKLQALRAACDMAMRAAVTGDLFATVAGVRLLDAVHDLTEIDAVYDMAGDVLFGLGMTRDDVK